MAQRGRKISIDEKIEKAKKTVGRTKDAYDTALAELEKLMTKKQEMRKEELMAAVVKSSRYYEEIMDFLAGDISRD